MPELAPVTMAKGLDAVILLIPYDRKCSYCDVARPVTAENLDKTFNLPTPTAQFKTFLMATEYCRMVTAVRASLLSGFDVKEVLGLIDSGLLVRGLEALGAGLALEETARLPIPVGRRNFSPVSRATGRLLTLVGTRRQFCLHKPSIQQAQGNAINAQHAQH
jgi:hypothetical protein